MTAEPRAEPRRKGPSGTRLVHLGIAAFVLTCALLLALGPLVAPHVSAEPGRAVSAAAEPLPDGTFRVTLDTRDRLRWVGFDAGLGGVPDDPARADLLAQRYVLRAPGGALDLGSVPLDRARVPEGALWVGDETRGGVIENPALAGWYRYSYFTHLLRSRGKTYALRRVFGRGVIYLRVEGYYCLPEGSGCLTLRYRLDHARAP